jgi:hypothetical protein
LADIFPSTAWIEASVEHSAETPLAWVESPLQLVAAAEWASSQEQPIVVVVRLGSSQMAATAEELLARGARFAECIPYYGIPWQLLARHRRWAIGDGFSGQFRLAASVLLPRQLTLLDDGAHTVALVDALLGRTGFTRPRQRESGVSTVLGVRARTRMLRLALKGRLGITTAFALGDARGTSLAERGVRVVPHTLCWVRRTSRPTALPGNRVLLGSARVVDGLMPAHEYLAWVASQARSGDLTYLPHRRETDATIAVIAGFPGVHLLDTGLPVELVLAGYTEPLEVISQPSSALTTLRHVLAGTGSTIRSGRPDKSSGSALPPQRPVFVPGGKNAND